VRRPDFREVKIFNRSNNVRSNPLSVTLLRDPAEEVCVRGATGFSACSWSDVLAVFGYTGPATTKPELCTIQQVASWAACEGP